jgi:cullin 1
MIAKMKLRAGPRFTSRLEGMLNDIAISRYMNTEFQNSIAKNDYDSFTPHGELLDNHLLPIEVKVLTQGIWPLLRERSIRPPREFSVIASLFQSFFENRKTRKVLRWAWELGTVTLLVKDAECKSIICGIICNTIQAFVLFLFNNYEVLTVNEICNILQVEPWIGIRLLHSLCCGKFKILAKSGHPLIVSASDSIWINAEFDFGKYSQKLIALPYPDLHERSGFSKGAYSCSIPIKAFIVRTMKKEKTIRISALIDRVMDSLERFRPELKIISSVIDNLIENEYLSRDHQVQDILHYVP